MLPDAPSLVQPEICTLLLQPLAASTAWRRGVAADFEAETLVAGRGGMRRPASARSRHDEAGFPGAAED